MFNSLEITIQHGEGLGAFILGGWVELHFCNVFTIVREL